MEGNNFEVWGQHVYEAVMTEKPFNEGVEAALPMLSALGFTSPVMPFITLKGCAALGLDERDTAVFMAAQFRRLAVVRQGQGAHKIAAQAQKFADMWAKRAGRS